MMENTDLELQKLDLKLQDHEKRLANVENQIGRITSHIESEVGLARNDINRVEERLLGKGDDEYGGRIGQLTKRQHDTEQRMMYGMGFLGCAFLVGEIILRLISIYGR